MPLSWTSYFFVFKNFDPQQNHFFDERIVIFMISGDSEKFFELRSSLT